MQGRTASSAIIDTVFEEAEQSVNTFAMFSSVNDVAAVYTALVSYFVTAQKRDDDLAHSLIPEYQRKIRGKVSDTEFSYSFGLISEAYTRFCEKGLAHSYKIVEWQEETFADYAEIILEMIGVRSNDTNKSQVLEIISGLFKTAIKDYSVADSLNNPTFSVGIAQLAAFGVLYLLVFQLKNLYSSFFETFFVSAYSESLSMLVFLGYNIGVPLVIAFCVSKAHIFIFRNYRISVLTGIVIFLVICTHCVVQVALLNNSLRYDMDRGGMIFMELWFFANMTAGFVYCLKPRIGRHSD